MAVWGHTALPARRNELERADVDAGALGTRAAVEVGERLGQAVDVGCSLVDHLGDGGVADMKEGGDFADAFC